MDIESNQFKALGHIVVVAGDYPAPKHMKLVFVQQLVDTMLDKGAKITVVAPQSVVHSLIHRKPLFQKHSFGISKQGKRYNIYRPYIITLGNTRLFEKVLNWLNNRIISQLFKHIDPNVLYTHFWSSALLVQQYAKNNRIPLFVACGEGDNALEDMISRMSSRDLNVLRSTVRGVISVSSENERKCIQYNLVDPENIAVFPNGVDIELFKRDRNKSIRSQIGVSEKDFLIIFVGGFIPRKGPDRLAKAISLINDPSIKVIFVGKAFPGYPFDFDCPGMVFKGPIPHEDLPLYLSSADIFVLPTQKEGCCNAIVEALSIGLPVISSNGAFNDDILDESNSIRINPNDISAIVDAIIFLKNNPSVRHGMSEVSNKRHHSYSIETRAERILLFMLNHCLEGEM